MKKPLIIVFVIALIIVIAELFYLFVLPKKSSITNNRAGLKSSVVTSPSVSTASSSLALCATPTPPPFSAIPQKTIDNLRVLHRGVLISSTATNEFRGQVGEFEFPSDEEAKKKPFPYAFKIRLWGDNNQTNAFLFTKKELENIRATQIVDGKEQAYNLKEIKIGDYVSLYLTFRLDKEPPDDNFISAKIVKLR